MSKLRFIACGSASALVAAGLVLAVPASRHFIRHEIATHPHLTLSGATDTPVVPVRHEVLPIAPVAEADARFSHQQSAKEAFTAYVRVSLEADGFLPPTATSTGKVTAGAPPFIDRTAVAPKVPDQDVSLDTDLAGAKQALRLYRQGDLAAGDDFAKLTSGPMRTLLDWVAIRLAWRQTGVPRMQAFIQAHADWPAVPWIKRRIEDVKASTRDTRTILTAFATGEPDTLSGTLALARAKIATNDLDGGARLVRTVWRDDDLTPAEESSILREFGHLLRREDHKFRADRFLYKENVPAALRAAALAGPDVVLLAKARIAVIGSAPSDAAIAAVPKALQSDPGLTFARIQKARRAGKIKDAAALMLAAPTDPAVLINGDEWWVERRLIARKLLDKGDPKTAYKICAAHSAFSNAMRVEAEFHAGWIALRFLKDPALAAPHFAAAARFAETPISIARAAYWQARAAQAAGDAAGAAKYYETAAAQPTAFYGQIASEQLGRTSIALHQPVEPASGSARREAVSVVSLLFALGERDLGLSLALIMARDEPDASQVAALAQAVAATRDARATLVIGKAAAQRGIPLDDAAFPTFGIPGYQPLTNSADRSVVFAIARQESEFDPKSVSSAGAKGLMQLISSTARQTAQHAGVDFNENRLLNDAAFNAQIGAAHLGKLLSDEGGSYILTFAAYNAGSRKVHEWIDAYGDPRKPGVDPIDWIERIPFTETRNYVQRVFENMQIYRTRFGVPTAMLVEAPKQQVGKGT